MNRYAYFLGCITPNRYPGIELATKKVLKQLGIEVFDMKGASCCPAPGVFGSFDLLTWLVVAARNISIAEEMDADITTTCNGCYGTLQEANHLLKGNSELKSRINNILNAVDREYKGTVEVKHVIEILAKKISNKITQNGIWCPLKGVKVAVHYGCHFLKPSDVRKHGTVERPTIIDDLVRNLGAESINYKEKMMCCGAGGGVRASNLDVALDYTREKIENMVDAGAHCIVTPCAFCHFQFDSGQVELTTKLGKRYELPVVFVTQLVGLALGLSPVDVGLHKNRTQIQSLNKKLHEGGGQKW